jgi:hypothetical protein
MSTTKRRRASPRRPSSLPARRGRSAAAARDRRGRRPPAPTHRATGIVGSSAILPGWVGVTAAEELRNRLELPVLVENDAESKTARFAGFLAWPGAVLLILGDAGKINLTEHGRMPGAWAYWPWAWGPRPRRK